MKKAMFLIAALLVAPAWAVNKCTGADGKVTYQDAACPISAKDGQQVKTWTTGGYGATAVSTGRRDVTPNPALNGRPKRRRCWRFTAAGPMQSAWLSPPAASP